MSQSATRVRERRPRLSRGVFLYLLKSLVLNWIVAFAVLEAVQGIILTVRATEGISLDFLIVFPILLRAFGQAVSFALPLAVVFGTGLLVGKLNADREMTGLRSFGFSPWQLLAPAAVFGGVLSLAMMVVNYQIVPQLRFANRNVGTLILERLGYLGEGWDLEYSPGHRSSKSLWIHHYDGPVLDGIFLSVSARGKDAPISEEALERVRAASYPVYLFAERARVYKGSGEREGQAVIRLQGVNVFFDNDLLFPGEHSDFMNLLRFEEVPWSPKLRKKAPGVKDLTLGPLLEEIERRRHAWQEPKAVGLGDDARAFLREGYYYAQTEFHRRLAVSLTPLSFPLLAFMIGLFVKSRNRLLPFFLASTIVPMLYFFLELVGNGLACDGVVPWLTEQFGNAALFLLCAVLLFTQKRGPR